MRHLSLTILATCAAATAAAQEDPPAQGQRPPDARVPDAHLIGEPNPDRHDAFQLEPPVHGEELYARASGAYQRGFDFLVATQNHDGSWGSHDPRIAELADFGFQLRNRGSQDGVRIACTALVVKALLRKPDRSEAEQKAFERGIDALAQTDKFAYEMGEAFNTWGYGYKLDALCDLLEHEPSPDLRAKLRSAAEVCILGLAKFQQVDGGWNYYSGPERGGESMSFNTANFAEALFRARRLGMSVPDGLIEDPAKLLRRMITVHGGVVYDARFLLEPRSVNELSSGARTAAVTECLAELGRLQQEDLVRALRVFDQGENWLEDGRKLIQPHTAVHQVSGYFFFYGYHYLSEVCVRLGDAVPRARWERNAWTMVRTQEPNGCWWDTPAGDYGDKWGTAFALLVLQRYLERPVPAAEPTTSEDGERP